MTSFDLPQLPLIYAGVLLAAVLLVWVWSAWRQARCRRKEIRDLCQCRLCAAWLRHDGTSVLLRCPQCGALNEPKLSNDI